jgi:DNA-binding winged helix-turn-helix (wHTH) protein/tetratricopeptide (TPR) repeat protein
MKMQALITFDIFALDPLDESLWRGSEKIILRPKSFALLHYLINHSGQLATKEQLLTVLWQNCNVGDGALKNCITEIRKALGDTAGTPRYIETVHRRGYRFIGKFSRQETSTDVPSEDLQPQGGEPDAGVPRLVGRESELLHLQHLLERAMEGTRQIAFVTGEQGIGKTTLVDEFLDRVNDKQSAQSSPVSRPKIWETRGQCIKSHGACEAYMPLWEALTGLCHESNRERFITVLRQHAPMCLLQMPSLATAAQLKSLRSKTIGASNERMLREITEALEAFTTETTLILVLEDLHWGDYSTLDWISYWAQRRSPARLLLIGTYRTTEAMGNNHPLRTVKQELQSHNQCQELPLAFLSKDAIGELLMWRFPGHRLPTETAAWIHQRTEGNPLFVINLLDHLVACELIVPRDKCWTLKVTLAEAERDVPPTIQQIIEMQIERCSVHEQRLLQAASVVGVEFSVDAAAAALGKETDSIETQCRNLAHRHLLLQPANIRQSPGGKREIHYRFSHVLYQTICYQILPEKLRAQLHRSVARYIERTNIGQLGDFAARLAMHFEQGQDYSSAIKYYQQAAGNANRRYSGREAQELAERGIRLLEEAPASPERTSVDIGLQIELGSALLATRGLGAAEVTRAFARAPELLKQLHEHRRFRKNDLLFSALWGLWNYSWITAEYAAAREAAEQLLQLAEVEQDSIMLAQAHFALGIIMMEHGELIDAINHMEQCPTVVSRVYSALTWWNLGYSDRSIKAVEEILTQVLETQNPEDCIFAYIAAARVHAARRESEEALDRAQAALSLARQRGFLEMWLAPQKSVCGWALAKLGRANEATEQMRPMMAEYRNIGFTNIRPFLSATFAEVLGDAGQIEEGLIAIQDAWDSGCNRGMNNHAAEIYRLKGELLLKRVQKDKTPGKGNLNFGEAESCFEQAITIARQQRAKSFELRATMSLARILQKQNRQAEARKLLMEIYTWFTEGHDTLDLRDARELLHKLS